MPIATADGFETRFNCYGILEKQVARILQPDPSLTGGITATKKIAAMADAHYLVIAPAI